MGDRTLLITGCSSGIGYDAAHGMRARGWRVFASCRKEEDCERLAGEGFDSPLIDYSRPDTIAPGLQSVLDATDGRLDGLFNNGAWGLPGAVEDLPTDGLREIFEANFFGWHELTRQVIPVMRAAGGGRIVQNSSILGFVPLRWRGAYVATKYALEGYSSVLRIELDGTGIHVSLIEPGPITSRIRVNSIPHFEKWIDWRSSALREKYEATLLKRLYTTQSLPDRFELPARAVTEKLAHALTHPRPRPRYFVTTPTHLAGVAMRMLPTRAQDWFVRKLG